MEIYRLAELFYKLSSENEDKEDFGVKWDRSLDKAILFALPLASTDNKNYNEHDCVYNLLKMVADGKKPYSYIIEELGNRDTVGRYGNIFNQWKIAERCGTDIFIYKNKDKSKLLQKAIDEDLLKLKHIASNMGLKYSDYYWDSNINPYIKWKGLHVWKEDDSNIGKLAMWHKQNKNKFRSDKKSIGMYNFIGGILFGVPMKENWAFTGHTGFSSMPTISRQDIIDFFGNDLAAKILERCQ